MSQGPAASAPREDVSSATPFEQDVAGMFGDFTSSGGETPEPEPTSAAGTTPAEPATGTESETETPSAAAGDEAATAVSDGTTPDTPPADAAAEADPFAGSEPLTFMVNGQPQTLEGVRVFKEGGAVIRDAATLDHLAQRLSERESLQERNHRQSVEYQTLARATEWTDPDGKNYTGPEAAIELRIGNAGLFAENQLLVGTLTDPDKLAAILAVERVPDGNGGMRDRVVVNPTALAHLQTQNELAQLKVAAEIRKHFGSVLAEAAKGTPAPIDFTAEAPTLIASIASQSQLDASVLTAADRALLAKQLPAHVKGGKVAAEWQELVKDRIQLRAEQKTQTKAVADTATKAAKDAQARMAAAARGVKPGAKPAVAPKPKAPSPQESRLEDEGALFDSLLSSGANAMRAAR